MNCNNAFKRNAPPKKMETEHDRCLAEDYLAVKVIEDRELEKGLIEVLLNKAKGVYRKVKIIPSDIALRGRFKPFPQSHIVYAHYNPNHSEVKKRIEECKTTIVAGMLHIMDKEGCYFSLNPNYSDMMLKLEKRKITKKS